MILITGATGFLGRFIVNDLLSREAEIRLLVRNPDKRKLPWKGLVDIVEGDVLDVSSLAKAMEGVELVIHAAAVVSFWRKKRALMERVNIKGTANVVDCCLENGVKRLVHISSIAAIGKESEKEVVSETNKWNIGKHTSHYAISKHKAELEVYRGVAEGLDAVIINPGVIIGPGDWDHGTPKMFSIMARGLTFYNIGILGLVSAKDVAEAASLMLDAHLDAGERFILVAENLSQKSFFSQIASHLDQKPPFRRLPPWLTLMVGFVSELIGNLIGKEPLISRASMQSSINQFQYDGSKILSYGFSYTPIEEIIEETTAAFKESKK